MKKIVTVLASLLVISGAISCKKSSDGGNNNNPTTRTVVYKLTLSPIPANNQGSLTGGISALLPNLKFVTWKVNGVLRPNENTISFTVSDFQNGALTLETTEGISSGNMSIAGSTTSAYPFTVVVQGTVNGKANDPVTIQVTSFVQRSFSL
jgi:hypothetical protein